MHLFEGVENQRFLEQNVEKHLTTFNLGKGLCLLSVCVIDTAYSNSSLKIELAMLSELDNVETNDWHRKT